jgi:hypothetical protein
MIDLPLTKVSETSTVITFSWTPVPCLGYVFYVNDMRVSNSFDPLKNTIRFHKVANGIYKVEAFGTIARGTYPPTSSPNSEKYSEDPYGNAVYSH